MKILVVLLTICALCGCSTMASRSNWPACNEKYPETHQLARAADSLEVCLKNVGDDVIIVSALALNVDRGFAAMAVDYGGVVLENLNHIHDGILAITGQGFVGLLGDELQKYPGLAEVLEININLLGRLPTDRVLDKDSVETLIHFFKDRFIPRMRRYTVGPT